MISLSVRRVWLPFKVKVSWESAVASSDDPDADPSLVRVTSGLQKGLGEIGRIENCRSAHGSSSSESRLVRMSQER